MLQHRLTMLLHTSNRPAFLRRTLSYVAQSPILSNVNLQIADGSDDYHWQQVRRVCKEQECLRHMAICHTPRSVPFPERLLQALEDCETPYVLLAADDDFYVDNWIEPSITELDQDLQLTAVYGHTVSFRLERYAPRGRLIDYYVHPRRVPELKWLEHNGAEERLAAISDPLTQPATPAWYAVQRVGPLHAACRIAKSCSTHSTTEYLQILCQAAAGKVRMLDQIALARQAGPRACHPIPDPQALSSEIRNVLPFCTTYLLKHTGMSPEEAEAAATLYFAGILKQAHRNAKPVNRFRRKLDAFPAISALKDWLRGGDPRKTAQAYPDPRFPPLPQIGPEHPLIKFIKRHTH